MAALAMVAVGRVSVTAAVVSAASLAPAVVVMVGDLDLLGVGLRGICLCAASRTRAASAVSAG